MGKVRETQQSSKVPIRLPRPFGPPIAKALNEMWHIPEHEGHPDNEFTEFVFKLPFSIPDELKRRNLAGYYRLFPGGHQDWSNILKKACASAVHRGRPVEKEIEFVLREVVLRAFQLLLTEHKDHFHQDEIKTEAERTALWKGVVKTGPQTNPHEKEQMDIRLAKRYRELMPQVKELRSFVNGKQSPINESELLAEITRQFSYSWILLVTNGGALDHLLPLPGHESRVDTLSSKEWTVRQLVVGIIFCEEHSRDPKFRAGPQTIYEKYIARGNRLISKNS